MAYKQNFLVMRPKSRGTASLRAVSDRKIRGGYRTPFGHDSNKKKSHLDLKNILELYVLD